MMILVLFAVPMLAGFFAMLAAFALAARIARVSEASYVAEPTPGETAEWIESFEDLDIDAEWIALADAPVPSPVVRSYSARIAEVCGAIKARTETRKAESRAAVIMAIVHWHGRADSAYVARYAALTCRRDANATLDRLDAIARYRQVSFDPSEVLPLAA